MVVIGNFRNRAEMRKKKRRHFHFNARAVADEKGTLLPCSIIDISESGARLLFETDIALPERFLLVLTASGDIRRQCRVVWREGTTVGVAFPTANL
jgi:hypothetical protein